MIYIDVDTQNEWARSCAFVAQLPWNHSSRKNIGYLAAIANGAEHVWDFDDDNELLGPYPVALTSSGSHMRRWSLPAGASDILNPYPLLGSSTFSWPRGFPLSRIKDDTTVPKRANVIEEQHWNRSRVAIVQALAEMDPDVDAVYRLTRPLPFSFAHPNDTILDVPRGTFAPLNAQATLFMSRQTLWTLLLPKTVHGRVSDIWRSYIMQRLLAEYGFSVAFAGAWVAHHRNPHSYIADFDSELPLYLQSDALVRVLSEWKSKGGTLPEMALELYVELYERGFFEDQDIALMKLWLDALASTGLSFPIA